MLTGENHVNKPADLFSRVSTLLYLSVVSSQRAWNQSQRSRLSSKELLTWSPGGLSLWHRNVRDVRIYPSSTTMIDWKNQARSQREVS